MKISELLKKICRRILYPHSYSSEALLSYIRSVGGVIGDNTYIYASHKHRIDVANARFLEIGDYCQITEGVVILAHDYSFSVLLNKYHVIVRKQRVTHIGNNVFIGMNSIVLMGSYIGDNVIIGAGSVVSGFVDSDSVYAGNPAHKICSLDDFHKKLKDDFVYSAGIYASKTENPNDMWWYRCLFENSNQFRNFLKSRKFHGIDEEVIDILNYPQEKLSWNEILDASQEKNLNNIR